MLSLFLPAGPATQWWRAALHRTITGSTPLYAATPECLARRDRQIGGCDVG